MVYSGGSGGVSDNSSCGSDRIMGFGLVIVVGVMAEVVVVVVLVIEVVV